MSWWRRQEQSGDKATSKRGERQFGGLFPFDLRLYFINVTCFSQSKTKTPTFKYGAQALYLSGR